jgi:hypothetical protein
MDFGGPGSGRGVDGSQVVGGENHVSFGFLQRPPPQLDAGHPRGQFSILQLRRLPPCGTSGRLCAARWNIGPVAAGAGGDADGAREAADPQGHRDDLGPNSGPIEM